MVTYLNITGTNKTYYKTGDNLIPVVSGAWSADANTTQSIAAGGFFRYGSYFETQVIKSSDAEGKYTVTSWTIQNTTFYLSKPAGTVIEFYILKDPETPVVVTSVVGMTVTLQWSSTSLATNKALIDWGDGESSTITSSTTTHTYLNEGSYNVSVTAINELNMQSFPKIVTVIIGGGVELVKHDTVYLLNDMKILKPIHTTHRIIFNTFNTTATFTMPYDPAIKCGMQIYLYHMFPQVFVIESISGERTISVSCVDYLTALLRGRVAFTGTTTSADGFKTYTGNAGELIPNIITDNLTPSPRGDTHIMPPSSATMGNDISIKTRYNQISSILESAISQSGLILTSIIFSDSPLLIKYDLKEPETRNILFDSRRLCGEMQSQSWVRKATTALVAGSGSASSRQTAWRGDTVSTDIDRVETYIDGGDSTETSKLEIQAGDNIIWKLSSNSPYKPYRDFWVGDKVYINETTTMVVTQIDFSKSTNGESIVVTLGYPCDGVDKTVYDMQTGITPNYR